MEKNSNINCYSNVYIICDIVTKQNGTEKKTLQRIKVNKAQNKHTDKS